MRAKFRSPGPGGHSKISIRPAPRPAAPAICAKHEKFQFFGNGLIAKSLKLEVTVLQRGRKSRSSREFLALVGRTSDQQSKAPTPELPAPPDHFGEADRETWYAILRENPYLNYSGCMLLGIAINALARAQVCAKTIDEAGGPLSVDNRGRPRRHPLAGLEVANRKLAKDLFKMLKIELREEV